MGEEIGGEKRTVDGRRKGQMEVGKKRTKRRVEVYWMYVRKND